MWIERNSCFYVQNAFDFRYAKIKRAFFICEIVLYREIEKNLGKFGKMWNHLLHLSQKHVIIYNNKYLNRKVEGYI